MRQYKILTWHVHGNYLYYLSQVPHLFYLPVDSQKQGDYMGKGSGFEWGKNVIEVPAEEVKKLDLDCVLFQREAHYTTEQFRILSEKQRNLPKIFLEHNPPLPHPTDTKHPVDDPNVLIVHVTGYNRLMWDCGRSPVTIIPHGVLTPRDAVYSGELESGITVINHIKERGRLMGYDLFQSVRRFLPLELAGMGSSPVGGLGEISHEELPYRLAKYRFFFSPIRYTSMPLSLCEAMMIGLPVIGLPATEMIFVVKNGINGYLNNDTNRLIKKMKRLLKDHNYAKRLGAGARQYAKKNFSIFRFVNDWNHALTKRIGK